MHEEHWAGVPLPSPQSNWRKRAIAPDSKKQGTSSFLGFNHLESKDLGVLTGYLAMDLLSSTSCDKEVQQQPD